MENPSPHNRFSKILHNKLTIIIVIIIIVIAIFLVYCFNKNNNCALPPALPVPNCQNIF